MHIGLYLWRIEMKGKKKFRVLRNGEFGDQQRALVATVACRCLRMFL